MWTFLIVAVAVIILDFAFQKFGKRIFLGKNWKDKERFINCLDRLAQAIAEINSPEGKLRRARKALDKLRDGTDSPKWSLDEIREALEIGWTHQQIGTSEIEVRKYQSEGESQKILAEKLLQKCRIDKTNPWQIRNLVEEGKFSLVSIKTSEAELNQLERESAKKMAVWYAQRIRDLKTRSYSDPDEMQCDYEHVLEILREPDYGFTPEELGVNISELDAIILDARKNNLICHLEWMKKSYSEREDTSEEDFQYNLTRLRDLAAKANITLEEVGVNETVLRGWLPKKPVVRKKYPQPQRPQFIF